MFKLGERIRKRRENLNIQTNDLAFLIGVTPSLISQIERAKAFPSIITLKKIADALQTSVGNLIGENETFSNNPLVSFDDKRLVQTNDEGTTLYLLSNHDQHKLFEPHLLTFPPGSNSTGLINYAVGQSFYYPIIGSFKIEINFKSYMLSTGDSFYLNSNSYHTITNTTQQEAHILWISANPIL
ncbi:MAG: helix-turn-helix domain-containing protein [Bacteroidales bacterium]|nr:helix-turn-helix domain-containing protein [Bacteroidales bacterium]